MYPSDLLHSFGINGKISGSIYAVGEMQGVLPVIHGAIGCGYHYRFSARRRHYPYFNVISSDLSEKEIIYGGEEKLYQTILNAFQRYHPKLILIIPTPTSDIIHEDIKAVAARARKQGIFAVAVKSESFSHRDPAFTRKRLEEVSKQKLDQEQQVSFDTKGCGYTEVLTTIVEDVMKQRPVIPRTVNIETIAWGKHGRQVIKEMEETLRNVDVHVISHFPSDSFENIVNMPSASLNIVRRIKWAKKMKEKFDTPYLQIHTAGKYQGLEGICQFYYDIGAMLQIPKEMDELIAMERKKTVAAVSSFKDVFCKQKIMIITRNLQTLPQMIKRYRVDLGFDVRYCFGICTQKHRENMKIEESVYENLLSRVQDAIVKYAPQARFTMNPIDKELLEAADGCDAVFGTEDPYYQLLGIPLVHPADEIIPLSFASYIRSVEKVYIELSNPKIKSHLLLNELNFNREEPLILSEENIQASRQMWLDTWFQKGK